MRWWCVALLLIPSVSAMDLYIGYGDQMFLSELQDDPRERATMAGRGVLGAPLLVTSTGSSCLGTKTQRQTRHTRKGPRRGARDS